MSYPARAEGLGKYDTLSTLALVQQPVKEKEISKFKPLYSALELTLCHVVLLVGEGRRAVE